MRPSFVSAFVVVAAAFTFAGCASAADEETAATDSALSADDAYRALAGKTLATRQIEVDCGHSLILERGLPGSRAGTYSYSFVDCQTGDTLRSRGNYKVVGGWIGGLLTDPTLEITPSSEEPGWTYKIRTAEISDGVPVGTIFLESQSAHGARLFPKD